MKHLHHLRYNTTWLAWLFLVVVIIKDDDDDGDDDDDDGDGDDYLLIFEVVCAV